MHYLFYNNKNVTDILHTNMNDWVTLKIPVKGPKNNHLDYIYIYIP